MRYKPIPICLHVVTLSFDAISHLVKIILLLHDLTESVLRAHHIFDFEHLSLVLPYLCGNLCVSHSLSLKRVVRVLDTELLLSDFPLLCQLFLQLLGSYLLLV